MAGTRRLPRARVEAQEGVAQIAAWLWEEMRKRGLNQPQTAAAMGVSLGRLREWLEADPPRPTPDACAAIARFLHRPTEEILRLAGRSIDSPTPPRADRPEVAAFSDWLSAELSRRGMSRADAAAAMGMHPRAMANWFGPHPRRPSSQMCAKLAQLLGVDADEVRARAGYSALAPDFSSEVEPALATDPPTRLLQALPPFSPTWPEPGEPNSAPDATAIRQAALQAAASFLAPRPGATIEDVETLAARWERWIRQGSWQ